MIRLDPAGSPTHRVYAPPEPEAVSQPDWTAAALAQIRLLGYTYYKHSVVSLEPGI
jgi:hypothetical protein